MQRVIPLNRWFYGVLWESVSFEKIGICLQVFRQSSRIYFLRLFFESLPAVKRRWTSKQLWIKHYDRLSVNILIAQWQVTIYFGHKREVTFNKRVTVNKKDQLYLAFILTVQTLVGRINGAAIVNISKPVERLLQTSFNISCYEIQILFTFDVVSNSHAWIPLQVLPLTNISMFIWPRFFTAVRPSERIYHVLCALT